LTDVYERGGACRIWTNRIGDAGVAAIGEALKTNTVLTRLVYAQCVLGRLRAVRLLTRKSMIVRAACAATISETQAW